MLRQDIQGILNESMDLLPTGMEEDSLPRSARQLIRHPEEGTAEGS